MMPFSRRSLLAGAALFSLTAFLPGHAAAQLEAAQTQARQYKLATASTVGTYHPVGIALSQLVKVKLLPRHNFELKAVNTAGSAENVTQLRTGKADFAIMQGLYGKWAWQGTGPMEEAGKQANLRSITMLWPEVEHVMLRAEYAKTGNIDDLITLSIPPAEDMAAETPASPEASALPTPPASAALPSPDAAASESAETSPAEAPTEEATPEPEPSPEPPPLLGFSIGEKGSGSEGTNRHLLKNLEIKNGSVLRFEMLSFGNSSEALVNGQIIGASLSGGAPVAAITNAFEELEEELVLLNFTPEQIAKADGGLGIWDAHTIPANTYPGQRQAVKTMSQPNFLAVDSDVSADDVYEITRSIYDNLDFLNAIHPATKSMSLGRAIDRLPVPLHPGAIRFYEEQGIEIPDELRPPPPSENAAGSADETPKDNKNEPE